MKRDNDLIRNILLTIEDCPDVPPNVLRIESFLDFCNEPAVISMHIELLKEAGLGITPACAGHTRSARH